MAEIKNNFLSAKMNKDVDDRILSKSEYRNAFNLQISKSENSDVGSLQTVLGNELVVNFNDITKEENLDCIGYFVDVANNRVFLFLTDYDDSSVNGVYNKDSKNYIYEYNVSQNLSSSNPKKLVEGSFLNFSKNKPVIGVNLLENLLFWTDNRNQPRKINIEKANPSGLFTPTYYTEEDQISVAKVNPVYAIDLYAESTLVEGEYETTMYDVTSEFLPPYGLTAVVDGAITTTDTFVIDNPGTGLTPQVGQLVSGVGIPNGVRVVDYIPGTFTVEVSSNITLSNDQVIKFNANPYYNEQFIGDPAYLEDKFVRFSYRYRFDDNEYSIFAPFTQIAYIPKQDGYFLYEPNPDPLQQEPLIDDETASYRSTIVSFMTNKVNNIFLQIKLPCPANQLESLYKISEIDILYKESDGLAVQVVDVIPVSQIVAEIGSSDLYVYNYQSKKPFKTLPERELIRVYDKTPVKALGQEVISNRVVYSNYQDKQGYPKFLNYNVACNEKAEFSVVSNRTSIKEYPNHSVKQNRNYEVGIVLSDKFGRQSGVILSNAVSSFDFESGFKAASLYVPYKTETSPGSNIPTDGIINQWPGLSFKILFNDQIGPNGISDWPGIYNGDSTSEDYNPLGWYSYKVVVKQTEQDYYNVYLPGIMASYPEDPLKELDKTSHFVLIGDNINKVPRDLNDISATQEQYRSSIKLYSRVNNIYIDSEPDFLNQQFYPSNTFSFVNTIATLNSLFPDANGLTVPDDYFQFYQNLTNPLIGRMSTVDRIGRNTDGLPVASEEVAGVIQRLAVLETDPFESRLDLYWETSTSGIISELNEAILDGSDAPASIQDWLFFLPESAEIGYKVLQLNFYFSDLLGDQLIIPIGDVSLTVQNLNGDDRTSLFQLVPESGDKFNIETTDYFYYGFNAGTLESYKFFINVTTFVPNTTVTTFIKQEELSNVAPTITSFPPTNPYFLDLGETEVWSFEGNNGSADPDKDQNDLTWSIFSGSSQFSINPTTGVLTQPSGDIDPGSYPLTIRLTDAGGDFDDFIFNVNYSDVTGITWEVTSGGPGIISTGYEPLGYFVSNGKIIIETGFSAEIRAGSFPFTEDDFVGSNVTITGEGTVTKIATSSTESGFSIDSIILGSGEWFFTIDVDYLNTGGGIGGMFIDPI